MSEELVTVLLMTYNHVNTFEKAIESVLAQKTNFKFKISVWDDCSTDGTSDIVRKYSEYPNVECVIRDKNVGASINLFEAVKSVDTKYFAVLETDDYWCRDDKLQIQVDILEKNPDCSFCAHNTLMDYKEHNYKDLYLKSKSKKYAFPNKIAHGKYIEPHVSARLYRTSCIDWNEIKDPILVTYDIASNFYYLTKGNLYYIDEVMSVYNVSGTGCYSSSSPYEQFYKTANCIYNLNKALDWKYNYMLAGFFASRLNLTVFGHIRLRYLVNGKNIDNVYKSILNKFYNDFLVKRKKKCLFRLALPLNKHKRISLELVREKDYA